MRVVVWIVRVAVFFALFAFALNNQHAASVHWFFGRSWEAPVVFIVLAAFGLGCAFGVFAMVPSWWRQRRVARREIGALAPGRAASPSVPAVADPELPFPPRDGL